MDLSIEDARVELKLINLKDSKKPKNTTILLLEPILKMPKQIII